MQIQKYQNVLAADPSSSVKNLKNLKNIDNQENAKEIAQQFEALFLQMTLKSMRDSISKDELFSSDENGDFATGLLDQQLAYNISKSGKGTGIASQVEAEIMRFIRNKNNLGVTPPINEDVKNKPIPNFTKNHVAPVVNPINTEINSTPIKTSEVNVEKTNSPVVAQVSTRESTTAPSKTPMDNVLASIINETKENQQVKKQGQSITPKNFIQEILKGSLQASAETGVPPQFILGHAALESGWGKGTPKLENGDSSFNIFNVKANKDWKGSTVDVATTEYINGSPVKRVETFKAYGSYEEAFKDYATLLKGSSRYASILGSQNSGEFAKGLQKAGYATDPSYSSKLEQVINGNTLKKSIIA